MPYKRPADGEAAANEMPLARVLQDRRLIISPFTYQGTARQILHDLAEYGYVLMHRDDL